MQQFRASQCTCEMTKLTCTKCSTEHWVLSRSPEELEHLTKTLTCDECPTPVAEITLPNTTLNETEEIQNEGGNEPEQTSA